MNCSKMHLGSLTKTTRAILLGLAVIFISAGIAQAATTISLNVQTDGTLGVTGLSSLGSASSTQLSANTAYFGQTATSTFSTAGALALVSALNKGVSTMINGTNTVTVASGAICTVADNTNATSTRAVVAGTTLTISVGSPTSVGNVDVVSYICL